MKQSHFCLTVFVLMMGILPSSAQTRTSYFVENSTNRHHLNAAFAPAQGYVALPFIGNLQVSTASNLQVSSLVYSQNDGSTSSFLDSGVSTEKFLSKISDSNHLGVFFNSDILDLGWRTGKGHFWTVNVGVETEFESTLPYGLFKFAKSRMLDCLCDEIDIKGTSLESEAYLQAAVGFSAPLEAVEGLRIGGKVKFVASLAEVETKIDEITLIQSEGGYQLLSRGRGLVAGGGVSLQFGEEGTLENVGFEMSDLGLAGKGFGLDAGISYTAPSGSFLDGFSFSAALNDFGWVFYRKDQLRELENGDVSFFEGVDPEEMEESSIGEDFQNLAEDLISILNLCENTAKRDYIKALAAKTYIGVGYSFLNDRMTAGLLYYHRFGKYRDADELTVSWNYAPAKCFDIALSYSFLNNRQAFGWLLSFTPKKGLNVFLGSDYTAVRYSSAGYPLTKGYLNFNIGLSIPIQSRLVNQRSEKKK